MKNSRNTLKEPVKPPKPVKPQRKDYTVWMVKNVITLALSLALIYFIFNKAPGYTWAYNNLLKRNFQYIVKNRKLNFDQKMLAKFGTSYEYLMHLRAQTPKDAVILFPEPKSFKTEGSPFKSGELAEKRSAIRFLHPRKLVLESELDKSAYAAQITHIAIVNGIGFDKVPYEVEKNFDHGVLPVKPRTNN